MSPEAPADLLSALAEALAVAGFLLRGGFHPEPGDAVPDLADSRPAATLLLVGNAGPALWERLRKAPEAGQADPFDRYTTRMIDGLARAFGAEPLYPFDGPPWHPFQRWAQRAEPGLRPSPLGILVHPVYGLWHAYRAALLFADALALPAAPALAHPCAECRGQPCLAACPAGALGPDGYDVPRCRAHLQAEVQAPCLAAGCLARRACPIGQAWAQPAAQAAHHLAAFARA